MNTFKKEELLEYFDMFSSQFRNEGKTRHEKFL